jgi:hypothetical protein
MRRIHVANRQCHGLMSISEADAPARSKPYFASFSGCAMPVDSRRSSLSRRALPGKSVPTVEIRSHEFRSVLAFVSFVGQIKARPASWNRSKLSITKSSALAVKQMKPDRRPSGCPVSAVMRRRDTERRGEFLITVRRCGRCSFRRPRHDSLFAQGIGL